MAPVKKELDPYHHPGFQDLSDTAKKVLLKAVMLSGYSCTLRASYTSLYRKLNRKYSEKDYWDAVKELKRAKFMKYGMHHGHVNFRFDDLFIAKMRLAVKRQQEADQ